MIRDLFVPLFPEVPFAPQLDVAADLALRLTARANVVFTRPDPAIAAAAVPEMLVAAGIVAEAIEIEEKRAQKAAFDEFDRWRTAYGLLAKENETAMSSIAAAWHERMGTVDATVVEIGRLCDLAIIGKPDPYNIVTEDAFAATVFDTGRPTIVVPDTVPQCLLKHAVIAWNGTLQASRAIHGAMPILRHAEKVSIFAPLEDADEASRPQGLIEHLYWHGIQSAQIRTSGEVGNIGRLLLESATEDHATMIVMGAYSHSRVREAVLGGVTRHVLKHAEIPVLMMH